jgi:hypothetical protein
MSISFRRPVWMAAGLLCLAASASALSSDDSVHRLWRPWLNAFGQAESGTALAKMEQLLHAYGVILRNYELEPSAAEILDRAVEDLSDFDLARFHELLPEERGGARELRLRADLEPARYRVRRAREGEAFRVGLKAPRHALGDGFEVLRVGPRREEDDFASYLLTSEFGVGIGQISWPDITSGVRGFLEAALTESGKEDGAALTAARADVARLHPNLGPEDLAVMAPLFQAFPAFSHALSALGRVEDVRSAPVEPNVQHVRLRLRGAMERFRKHHPAFAKYLENMGKLGRFQLRVLDGSGRNLATALVESEALRIDVECYLQDGALVPWTKQRVFHHEPLLLEGPLPFNGRVVVDGRIQLLGLMATFTQLEVEVGMKPSESSAQFELHAKRLPKTLSIDGAVFGFMPLPIVNTFIPGDVRSLTLDFFRVAVEGNARRGAVLAATVGSLAAGGDGVVEGRVDVEALDNPLVQMAMATVNQKLVPAPSVVQDGKAFLADLQEGLEHDLRDYRSRPRQ